MSEEIKPPASPESEASPSELPEDSALPPDASAEATIDVASSDEPQEQVTPEEFEAEFLLQPEVVSEKPLTSSDDELKAVIEAIVYVTDEPLTLPQIATALLESEEKVAKILDQLVAEYAESNRGLTIREVAGGYKMGTKPEHHETIKQFVRNLKPQFKLSLPALETLAVIAYKQPITAPEIMEIRGVQGAGVLKTLVDRKLVTTAGRKNVIGKPILYKTTKEFLVQFGLKDLAELPTLKEFEELKRLAVIEEEPLPMDDETAQVTESPNDAAPVDLTKNETEPAASTDEAAPAATEVQVNQDGVPHKDEAKTADSSPE